MQSLMYERQTPVDMYFFAVRENPRRKKIQNKIKLKLVGWLVGWLVQKSNSKTLSRDM